MKIAYVHNCLWPSNIPGVSFVTYNAEGFSKAGYDLTLFVRDNSSQSTGEILRNLFNIKGQCLNLQRVKFPCFLKTNHLYFYKVYRIIKHQQFDVLITRHSSFLPYLVWLKRYFSRKGKKVKILYEPHDFYYDLSLRNDLNARQIKRSRKNQCYERKCLPSLDGLIFIHPNLKTYYEKYLPDMPGTLAYTGVTQAYENTIHSHKNQLIYIGSIAGEMYSGIYDLVKALEFLPKEIELTVIGGRTQQEISKFYQNVNPALRNRVTVTGWIKRPEIEKIVLTQGRIAAVLLHSAFFGDSFAYPLKFSDYISFGLPMICSLVENNKLIQENVHGVFLENDNPVDLAEKIRSLWYDEERLNRMSRHIHQLAKERLWENRARVIVTFLETLF